MAKVQKKQKTPKYYYDLKTALRALRVGNLVYALNLGTGPWCFPCRIVAQSEPLSMGDRVAGWKADMTAP